jgi:predicted dehydrogenase
MGAGNSIASILEYDQTKKHTERTVSISAKKFNASKPIAGLLGAGNFSRMTMLPVLKKAGVQLKYIASAAGLNGTDLAKKYGAAHSTTDYKAILEDIETNTFIISTQHGSHANFVKEGLAANKHVFVEKPMAIDSQQLSEIEEVYSKSKGSLMVGFNRRFSPHSVKVKSFLIDEPIQVIATMNAGFISPEVWVHDMKNGGGRIIGEACHYVDLISYFTGSDVIEVCMNAMGTNPKTSTDNASIMLKYKNGSTGIINYFSNGSKKYAKERVEVYSLNRTFIIDNFRLTTAFGQAGFTKMKTSIDKGHKAQFTSYLESIEKGSPSLIPFNSLINTTKASFAAIESLQTKAWITIK